MEEQALRLSRTAPDMAITSIMRSSIITKSATGPGSRTRKQGSGPGMNGSALLRVDDHVAASFYGQQHVSINGDTRCRLPCPCRFSPNHHRRQARIIDTVDDYYLLHR